MSQYMQDLSLRPLTVCCIDAMPTCSCACCLPVCNPVHGERHSQDSAWRMLCTMKTLTCTYKPAQNAHTCARNNGPNW